jgi:putative aminopeptidase FrvX
MIKLLEKLCLAPGAPGFEKEVRDIFVHEVAPYCDKVETDRMGNAIATRKGSDPNSPSLMISAHLDEVGLQISAIEETGLIKFEVLGFLDPRVLAARMVQLLGSRGPIMGVIGALAPHLQTEQEKTQVLPSSKLFIDCGFADRDTAEKSGLSIGTAGVFKREFISLSNKLCLGSAMDNRVGVTVAIEVLRNLQGKRINPTVFVVGSTQEEVGMRGIRTATYSMQPGIALPLDVTPHHPDSKGTTVRMGGGPVLRLMEHFGVLDGLISDPGLVEKITTVADNSGITIQRLVRGGGLTEGSFIHLSREGIPTCPIQVPSRYSHTGLEVVDITDMQKTTQLMVNLIQSL